MLYLIEALEAERKSHREILTEDRDIVDERLEKLITRFNDLIRRFEQDRAQFKVERKIQQDEFERRDIIQKARLEQLRKLVERQEYAVGLVTKTRPMRFDDYLAWIGMGTLLVSLIWVMVRFIFPFISFVISSLR